MRTCHSFGWSIVAIIFLIASDSWNTYAQPGSSSPQRPLTAEQKAELAKVSEGYERVIDLLDDGKTAEGYELANKALAVCQRLVGNDHPETARALCALGYALLDRDDYQQSNKVLQESLRIRKQELGDEHPDTAESMAYLAATLEAMGSFPAAKNLALQSLAIRKKKLGEEHPKTARSLGSVGGILLSMGDYPAAKSYYEQQLAVNKKVFGENHRSVASGYNNLGYVCRMQGETASALRFFEQALQLNRKLYGEEHVGVAANLNNVGLVLQEKEEFAEAARHYEQSLKIRQKLFGEDGAEVAQSLNNVGTAKFQALDYVGARANFEKALAIMKRSKGTEHDDVATLLNNLGHLAQEQGDLVGARAYLEEALRIKRKQLGDNHVLTAQTLSNLALLIKSQGDLVTARTYAEQVLQVYRRIFGDDHASTALAMHNLAAILKSQTDYKAARYYYEQALRIRRRIHGEDSIQTAVTLNNLGGLVYIQGDTRTSIQYTEQAIKIYQKRWGDEHPDLIMPLNNLGNVLTLSERYDAARPPLSQSLKIARKYRGNEHPDTIHVLKNTATLEACSGRWDEAVRRMDESRRASQMHVSRVLPSLSAQEQLFFLRAAERTYFDAALSLAVLRRDDLKFASTFAAWLANGKAASQESLAAQTLLIRDKKNPAIAEDLEKLTQLRLRLATLALAAPNLAKRDQRVQELEALTAEEQQLSRKVVQAGGTSSVAQEWVDTAALRKSIPADSVFVDFVRHQRFQYKLEGPGEYWREDRYAAWVVPPLGKGEVQIVDLGPAEPIDSALESARKMLTTAGSNDGALRRDGELEAEKQVRIELNRVSELVWNPVAVKIGGAKNLILSPDGALWLLPWGALPVSADKCLLEQYALRFVISGRALASPVAYKQQTSKAAIFADPDFNLSPEQSLAATKAVLPAYVQSDSDVSRGLSARSIIANIPRLPNTALEAQAVIPSISQLNDSEPNSYIDRYALESVAKRVERPKLLMFATHGFFLPDQETKASSNQLSATETRSAAMLATGGKSLENPLLRCGLLLAGCNQSQRGDDDGVLTGMEIVGLDLRGTELVVLSACETGVGKVEIGEGVAGLRQAFQLAGAQAVVSTLWQVPDRDSALIMSDFFANMAAGQSKPEALRNAQLKRIAARRERYNAAHPFFWAAWTITGN